MKTSSLPISSRRGSALISTIIFTTILLAILGSLLSWTANERFLSYRHSQWLEARNAAEAVAEYGFHQIAKVGKGSSVILSTNTTKMAMFKSTGTSPLVVPDLSFFSGSNVATTGTGAPELSAGSLSQVTNGTGSTATQFFYNSGLNSNTFDTMVSGNWVQRRDIVVLAKATVTPPRGRAITSYLQETLSIRAQPLFTAAIFYNMDMELSPGPAMNIGGPVVVNGSLYVGGRGATITFQDTVTTSGDIFHALKNKYTLQTKADGSYESFMGSTDGDIKFKTSASTYTSMKSGSSWNDSSMNLSSAIMTNITSYTNVADYTKALTDAANTKEADYKTYVDNHWSGYVSTSSTSANTADIPGITKYAEQTGTTSSDPDNSVNSGHLIIEPALDTSDPNYKATVEAEKFSTKAGLYFVVNPSTGAYKIYVGGSDVTGGTDVTALYNANATALNSTNSVSATDPAGSAPLISFEKYTATSTTVSKGLYDQRRGKGVNLVKLNYAKLRAAVAQLSSGSPDTTLSIPGLTSSKWTGVVYVAIAGGPTTRTKDLVTGVAAADALTKAGSTIAATDPDALITAVNIINGKNTNSLSTPSSGTTNPGLTIATNNPVYITGSFNANGTTSSTSLTTVDNSSEQPAAIAGDAITVLSSTFDTKTSKTTVNPTSDATDEISAAFVTGITPTNKNGNTASSGGAHNIVRFLENWGSGARSVYIRGSLCCMYESRVATERFSLSYYSPPARNWGLNQLFRNGSFPPGTPLTISFRRIGFKELSPAEYAAAKAAL